MSQGTSWAQNLSPTRTPVLLAFSRGPYESGLIRDVNAAVSEALFGCSLATVINLSSVPQGPFPHFLFFVQPLGDGETQTSLVASISHVPNSWPDFDADGQLSWKKEPKHEGLLVGHVIASRRDGWRAASDELGQKVCSWIDANYKQLALVQP